MGIIIRGITGHGGATAKRLAKDGYGIIAFHFDRGDAKKIAEETISEVMNYQMEDVIILT